MGRGSRMWVRRLLCRIVGHDWAGVTVAVRNPNKGENQKPLIWVAIKGTPCIRCGARAEGGEEG